ncbi:hypothetical protein Cni_G02999 [Canna indica]|uniref:Uncharacterized protein n=1 Tax=Canna indica TaxID=4628 RepID=A0AAQ3Q361_9LILI|nr:hypothetical protein Cni_G02999 [Canna indica]
MTDMAMSLGFNVRVTEPNSSTDLAKFVRLVNFVNVMIGVHGAELTNMVFLLVAASPLGRDTNSNRSSTTATTREAGRQCT